MEVTINNKSTTTEQSPKPLGILNAFYWYQIFALDSVVVETQRLFSLHGGFLTIAIFHHRETIGSNYHTMMIQRKLEKGS